MQHYRHSTKGSRHAKNTSINMSRFFIIIKTLSISCNLTDQLLFTYKMALRTATVLFMDGVF